MSFTFYRVESIQQAHGCTFQGYGNISDVYVLILPPVSSVNEFLGFSGNYRTCVSSRYLPGRFSPPTRPGYEATCTYILVLHTRGDYNHTSLLCNASMQLVLCHPCGHQIIQSESGFSNGHLRYSGKSTRVYYSRSQQSHVWMIYFVVSTTMNFVINDVPKDAKKMKMECVIGPSKCKINFLYIISMSRSGHPL